jgi:hypothetical protein
MLSKNSCICLYRMSFINYLLINCIKFLNNKYNFDFIEYMIFKLKILKTKYFIITKLFKNQYAF